ncbi:MAG: hypothetical protein WC455_29645 [Dehalococcoidia bacterium]
MSLLDAQGRWISGTKPVPWMSDKEWTAYRVWQDEQRYGISQNENPVVARLRSGASGLPSSGDFDRVFQRGSSYQAGTSQSIGQQSVKWVDCTPYDEDKSIKATVPVSVDWKRGCRQYLYLTENRNIYLLHPLDQTCCLLVWQRKAAGDATITFMDSFTNALYPKIYWAGGAAPTMTATLNAFDMFSFVYIEALQLYAGMFTQNCMIRTA